MTPLVLVHGYLASPLLMTPLARRLARAGRAVTTPDLAPLALRDARHHAGELDAAVDRVRHAHGADAIDVVAVSQGGLVALWWAQHRDGWPRIRRLCLVGAPVRGTWAAIAGLPLLGAWSPGIWQLLPSSPLVAELAGPLPTGARLATVALAGDPLCPPARCAVDGADNRVVDEGLGPLGHQWLMFSTAVTRAIEAALEA